MYKYETKVCPKMWAYFALRAGWFKINVGTNLGPQIYMYLSALGTLPGTIGHSDSLIGAVQAHY